MNGKKKKWLLLGILGCLNLVLLGTPVSAKKVSAKYVKRANKAYSRFLEKKEKKYKWFEVLNIGADKEPILLAADSVLSVGTSNGSITPGYTTGGKLFYYTGTKVKAVKGGKIGTNDTGLLLTKKKGGIFVGNHWGLGTLVKVKKGKTVGKAVLVQYENGYPKYYTAVMRGGKYYNKKLTTKAVYNKYSRKWTPKAEKDSNGISKKTIYLKKNTQANRDALRK